jgi:hypothetical protein
MSAWSKPRDRDRACSGAKTSDQSRPRSFCFVDARGPLLTAKANQAALIEWMARIGYADGCGDDLNGLGRRIVYGAAAIF